MCEAIQLQRRYRFFRAYLQAPLNEGVFGTAYYRLVRLDLATGEKETVAIHVPVVERNAPSHITR